MYVYTCNKEILAHFNLAVVAQTAKPPNLSPRQMFRLYGIRACHLDLWYNYLLIAFTEEPRSQTVNEGEPATFRCQHPRASFIVWTLNNESLDQHPPQNLFQQIIFDSTGNDVELLTISALAVVEFNGTIVVCEAHFIDGSPPEISSPAVLRGIYYGSATL